MNGGAVVKFVGIDGHAQRDEVHAAEGDADLARRLIEYRAGLERWVLRLPWGKPPMSLNDRDHYHVKRRKTAMIRNTSHMLTRQAKVPALERCSVQVWYAPTDRRRRDADNLAPVAKACCDGVVDAGVVGDDTPDLMVKPQSRICDPIRGGRLWLVITDLSEGAESGA